MEKKEMKGGVFDECLLMNIFPTGCPHGQREGGESAKCRQLQIGGGGAGGGGGGCQKSLKMCGHPLWMAPYVVYVCHKTYIHFQGTPLWLLLLVKVCDKEFYRAHLSSLKFLL